VKRLKGKQFGKSSEKLESIQSELFDEDETVLQTEDEPAPDKQTVTYERSTSNRKKKNLDTSTLPREVRVIDLTDAEKQCTCGRCMEVFGQESKEELVFEPATLKVIEHVRPKYTCRHCETVKTAKAVELPLPKSKAGSALIAEVMMNKYAYHLPFYRQSKMFAMHGLSIPDNTLAGWVMQAAEALAPLQRAFFEQLGKVHALQADETPVKILQPEKKAYMWLYHSTVPNQRFVLFDFNLSRAAAVVDERLKDFSGLLQTDGYGGYNTQRKKAEVITLGCWDHARRKFAEVVKVAGNNKTGKAGQILKKIAKLYEIEREIQSQPPSERCAQRQKQSKPKLEIIKTFLDKINAPPSSLLGKAVFYCKNQWPELIRYIDHGEAEISNCWVENQVRPFALGRRNWLFVGNEGSAQKAALIYSLIQSCLLNDIQPKVYLEVVLNQVHAMRRKEIDPATLLPHTIDKALLQNSTKS